MSGGNKAITINSYLFSDHQMISLKFNDQKKDAGNPELMDQDSGPARVDSESSSDR
jgi:hypothetical protein